MPPLVRFLAGMLAAQGALRAHKSPLIKAPFNSVDKGWLAFDYGPKGTEAHSAFMAVSNKPVILRITDTLRPGSSFLVAEDAQVDAILVTPTPRTDKSKRTVNPLRAYNSDTWSHGDAVLEPGFHQIRIFTRKAPYGGGTGALSLESARRCRFGLGPFFVIDNSVGWPEAAKLCEAYGGTLANLHDLGNARRQSRAMQRAFSLVRRCRVEEGRVWIRGQALALGHGDEDAFPNSLQALSSAEGITGAEWEHTRMAVLCEYPGSSEKPS